jgi:FO synthase
MTRTAGELRIPFTSGILIGIGETRLERVQSVLAIREEHTRHGHIQEVIVQNFRSKPETPMACAPEPDDFEVAHAVALARLILPDDVTVQAPPNLNPHATELLVQAGINDFGGISPVTPDFINPHHPWPHLSTLHAQMANLGFELRPRLPVHDGWLSTEWIEPELLEVALATRTRLDHTRHPDDLAPALPQALPHPTIATHQESP